jgi:hypothetical protein
MDSKELCEKIINDIEKAKSDGTTSIQCDQLIAYLNDIDHTKRELSAGDLAFYNATNQLLKTSGSLNS